MRLWHVLLLLLSGCFHEYCGRRHAQWLSLEECQAFCKNYEGVYNYEKGVCVCELTYSSEYEAEKRRKEALLELGISEEELRSWTGEKRLREQLRGDQL